MRPIDNESETGSGHTEFDPAAVSAHQGAPAGELSENGWVDHHEQPEDVRVLMRRSVSDDYKVRSLASMGLSNYADAPVVAERVPQLVLDPDNTMVTLVAVTALIAGATRLPWQSWPRP
ncbi:MAG: hypothetical protein ABI112_07290 [Terracoccus sp.]